MQQRTPMSAREGAAMQSSSAAASLYNSQHPSGRAGRDANANVIIVRPSATRQQQRRRRGCCGAGGSSSLLSAIVWLSIGAMLGRLSCVPTNIALSSNIIRRMASTTTTNNPAAQTTRMGRASRSSSISDASTSLKELTPEEREQSYIVDYEIVNDSREALGRKAADGRAHV